MLWWTLSKLRNSNAATRKVAMGALGVLCPTKVLVKALHTARPYGGYHADIRAWAAQVLADQRTPAAIAALVLAGDWVSETYRPRSFVESDYAGELSVEVAIRRGLASIGDSTAFRNLTVWEANKGSRSEKVWMALGEFAVAPLASTLSESHAENAARILGQLGDPRAVAPLVALARNGSAQHRAAAAMALDALGWTPTTAEERTIIAIEQGDLDRAVNEGAEAFEPLLKAYNTLFAREQQKAVGDALLRFCASNRQFLKQTFVGVSSREEFFDVRSVREDVAKTLCAFDDFDVMDFFASVLEHGLGSKQGGAWPVVPHDRLRQAGDCLSLLIPRNAPSLSVEELRRLLTHLVSAISSGPVSAGCYETHPAGEAANKPLFLLLSARAASLGNEDLQALVSITDPTYRAIWWGDDPEPYSHENRIDLSRIRALAEKELQNRRGAA